MATRVGRHTRTLEGTPQHARWPPLELKRAAGGGTRATLLMGYGATAPLELSSTSENEHLVRGLRLLLGEHGAADGHDSGDDAVDALGRLVLGGL
jgi:hypothetical protein